MILSSFFRRIREGLTSPPQTVSKPIALSNQPGRSPLSEFIETASPSATQQPTVSITIAGDTSSNEPEKTMSFTAILKALSLIPSILPVIAAFVQQADTLLSGSPGTAKLQAVLAAVTAYLAKIEADADVIAELQKLVTPLIEGAVAFAHTASPPAVTTGATAKA